MAVIKTTANLRRVHAFLLRQGSDWVTSRNVATALSMNIRTCQRMLEKLVLLQKALKKDSHRVVGGGFECRYRVKQ